MSSGNNRREAGYSLKCLRQHASPTFSKKNGRFPPKQEAPVVGIALANYLAASVFSPACIQPEMPADMCFTFV